MHVFLAIVFLYLVLHLVTGHARHRLGGRRVNYGWSLLRGPWFSFRLFGGRYYHHL